MSTSFWFLDWAALPPWAVAALIFSLRSVDLTLSTLRMLATARGRRGTAWLTGFAQSAFFLLAIVGVLQELGAPLNLLAYAAGCATGVVLGLTIEAHVIPGHSVLRVISPMRGAAVAERLRAWGHGATEVAGQGRDGSVSVILCNVPRRQVELARRRILEADPAAFVSVEHVRELRGGWGT